MWGCHRSGQVPAGCVVDGAAEEGVRKRWDRGWGRGREQDAEEYETRKESLGEVRQILNS